MYHATKYLLKQALDLESLLSRPITDETVREFFPQRPVSKTMMQGREALMDLGPAGVNMPREEVKRQLADLVQEKGTPYWPYLLGGGLVGAGAAGVLPKLLDAKTLRGFGKKLTKIPHYPLYLAGGGILGASVASLIRQEKRRRAVDAAVDEYNRMQLARMYK